jgi:hypothetical protein
MLSILVLYTFFQIQRSCYLTSVGGGGSNFVVFGKSWSCREWRCNATFLDFGTRWRPVINITPRPLYPLGNLPRYPLGMRLGDSQSMSGLCREKKLLPCWVSNPGRPSGSFSLYWLSYSDCFRVCGRCIMNYLYYFSLYINQRWWCG